MNKPNTVIFSIKNILPCWTDGGQPWFPSRLPVLVLLMYSQASVTTDPHFSRRWSSPSPSFEDAALEASTLCHNLTGWTSSTPVAPFRGFSLLLSLVSGPASLHMTVSPCQEQPFSKGLRAVQLAFQGDGCCGTSQPRNQWTLTASHFTAEYRVSKQVQGKQTCLDRGNVWPSLKCCFETGDDCWLLKNAQYVHKEKTTPNIKYSHFQVQKILQRWRAEADSLGEPLKQLNKFFT